MPRSRLVLESLVGLGVLAAASVLNWLRLPAHSRDTMYAEDGARFIQDSINLGWSALLTPYDGYQHLLPRVVAHLVTRLTPPEQWAMAMSFGGCVVVGLVAAIVWWATATMDLTTTTRLGLVAIPVLSPVAGIESIANMANVHWYFLYAVPWLLLARARNRALAALAFLVMLVAVLTEVQTVLWAPLAGVLLMRRREHRAGVLGWILGAAIQTASYLLQGRSGAADRPPFEAVWHGSVFNSFLGGVSAHVGLNQKLVALVGWWAVLAMCIVMVLTCWVLLRRASGDVRLLAFLLPLVAFGSWALAHYYLNYPALNFIDGPFKLARWGTGSAMVLWALVPLAFGSLQRRWLGSGAVLVFVALMAGSFVVPNSRFGVYWQPELAKAQQTCQAGTAGEVSIETLPADWYLDLPCSAVNP